MNLATLFIAPNQTMTLLFGGMFLLMLNIFYGLLRVVRGHVKAGWFTVVIAVVACVLIGVGSIQLAVINASASGTTANAQATGTAGRSGFTGRNRGTPTAAARGNAADAATPTANTAGSGAIAVLPTNTPRPNMAATADPASGDGATSTPSRQGTGQRGGSGRGSSNGTPAATIEATAQPTADASLQTTATPGRRTFGQGGNGTAGGGVGRGGSGTGTGGTGSGNNSTSNQPGTKAPLDSAGQVGFAGIGLVAVLLAGILYSIERRRKEFTVIYSRGLLNIGAALFVVVAICIIPGLPGQFTQPAQVVLASGGGSSARATFQAPTRVVNTATPTNTPVPTGTPTALPSLTPAPTDTAIPQPTRVVYNYTEPTNAATTGTPSGSEVAASCTVFATTNVNLRPDPSTNNAVITTILSGAQIVVMGESKDKQWLQVKYSMNSKDYSGWVNAQFTTSVANCAGVVAIEATPKP